jgi:hypothetical protein
VKAFLLYFGFLCFFLFQGTKIDPRPSFDQILDEYKKGNFETASRLARESLSTLPPGSERDKAVYVLISTEKSLKNSDSVLETEFRRLTDSSEKRSPVHLNTIYILLERSFVAGDSALAQKWGYRLKVHGVGSAKHKEGLYLYACSLFEAKKWKAANIVVNQGLKANPPPQLRTRWEELKIAVEKELGSASPGT